MQRVRPKVMTVATTMLGLLPIMWAPTMGTGAGVTKRIAAPMIGGLVTSTLLTLVVILAVVPNGGGRIVGRTPLTRHRAGSIVSFEIMNDTREGGAARSSERPSGRFVLRIDPALHAALKVAAEAAGTSLNEHCARKLAAPGANLGSPAATAVVERAATLLGGGLVGVVVFGSWARDEVTEGSDVDLLVVVEDGLILTRDLYRRWDESPVRWEDRRVEPHFVHLPAETDRVAGLWAEVAVDGIVLFERGLAVSRRLVALRRDIVDGRIVRRTVHGQPYWVEAA